MFGNRRRTSPGRRGGRGRDGLGGLVGRGVLMWVLVLGGLRAFVVQAEHCGEPDARSISASVDAAVGWFARNQNDDGTWLYRYDRDADAPVAGYNITRHAGVTMSLEQAAALGFDAAAPVSEAGIDWALGSLVEGPGWRAFASSDTATVSSGPSALLTAALVHRRDRTSTDTYDEVIHQLGAFMVAMVNERGQVYAEWDVATAAPVPELFSRYFTGEVFWALALLHRTFPADDFGYGAAAERVARYIATERTEVEQFEPDLPDHWAAYGFAVMTSWPGYSLPEDYDYYVRRQSGLQSLQIRYESQRTNSTFSYVTRGRQTLGAGLGTIGEALGHWAVVAEATPRFGDITGPLAERTRCVAGTLIARQVGTDDVSEDDDPDVVLGAWFQFDVTQMDDQQHALSALLTALPRTSTTGVGR